MRPYIRTFVRQKPLSLMECAGRIPEQPHELFGTNRFGIRHVVLIRLDVRLHELRCHQLYGMSELLQLPRPVMRAATCLHPIKHGVTFAKNEST